MSPITQVMFCSLHSSPSHLFRREIPEAGEGCLHQLSESSIRCFPARRGEGGQAEQGQGQQEAGGHHGQGEVTTQGPWQQQMLGTMSQLTTGHNLDPGAVELSWQQRGDQ